MLHWPTHGWSRRRSLHELARLSRRVVCARHGTDLTACKSPCQGIKVGCMPYRSKGCLVFLECIKLTSERLPYQLLAQFLAGLVHERETLGSPLLDPRPHAMGRVGLTTNATDGLPGLGALSHRRASGKDSLQ
jgi:hypothetical protein